MDARKFSMRVSLYFTLQRLFIITNQQDAICRIKTLN